MGDIAVESPANTVQPHKKFAPSAIPTIDNFEGLPADGGDEYANLKKLQRQLECGKPVSDNRKPKANGT